MNHHKYYDFNEARRAVFEYIESWYNQRGIHNAINYKTPQEVYETALLLA
ncbi:IS3 family transposase [Thermoanaerobacterium thermosaccharolyticum]